MEFEDRDEGEGELGSPVPSTYDAPMSNSGQGGGIKESGGGESAAAATGVEGGGTDHRKIYGGGGGGGRKYRECLKNQAVGIGAHAVDGCREFMAGGEEGTLDALRCAACGCHRNFHRKEQEEGGTGGGATPRGGAIAAMELAGYHPQFSPYYRTPAGYLHHNYAAAAAAAAALGQQPRPAPLALPSTSGGGGHIREEQEDALHTLVTVGGAAGSGSGLQKRFRTKFSQEQKDRMLAFAQQLGWRIQKHDEAAVQQFCQETCVKRHALKVWMHNNKQTLGKKP